MYVDGAMLSHIHCSGILFQRCTSSIYLDLKSAYDPMSTIPGLNWRFSLCFDFAQPSCTVLLLISTFLEINICIYSLLPNIYCRYKITFELISEDVQRQSELCINSKIWLYLHDVLQNPQKAQFLMFTAFSSEKWHNLIYE